jgi:hypothetical protein
LTPARTRAAFWAILALALVLRLYALSLWSIHHPDEIFQYLEPAHRLLFGRGVVTWDYRYEIRGWLLPLLLTAPMALGEAMRPGGELYLLVPRLMASLISLGIPVGAYFIGKRTSSLQGLIAMFVMTIWFECIYFSAHVLTEMLATALFMPAAALMLAGGSEADTASRRRFALAGLLLGLAGSLRFQYLPPLGLFALMTCGLAFRVRWFPLLVGGLLAAIVSATCDMVMQQTPYLWIIENFRQNIGHGRALVRGPDPFLAYFTMLAAVWRWAMPMIFLLMAPVIRTHRVLFATALVALGTHMLTGHKEYRYIILAGTIFVLLAALGSAHWSAVWAGRMRRGLAWVPGAAVCGAWAVASILLATGGEFKTYWSDYRPQLDLSRLAGRNPALCGISLNHLEFWETGGYTYLHRDVPIYITDGYPRNPAPHDAKDRAESAFNAMIIPVRLAGGVESPWRRKSCIGTVCLFERSGGCDPAAARASEINTLLRRADM